MKSTFRKPPLIKTPKVAPKRPSGQFQSTRENTGKINGGDMGAPMHPQSHKDFEAL